MGIAIAVIVGFVLGLIFCVSASAHHDAVEARRTRDAQRAAIRDGSARVVLYRIDGAQPCGPPAASSAPRRVARWGVEAFYEARGGTICE